MKEWYAQLPQREQLSLIALGFAVVLYLGYQLIWSPLQARREQLTVQNRAVAASLQQVDAMVAEILQLRESEGGGGNQRNLTSLINESTTRLALQVSRLQPNNRGEIQVRLESVAFDQLLSWLYEMEFQQGLLVREVAITQTGVVGRVDATVRIGQAQ